MARPPSPPMALTSMNERRVSQPGAFLFLFEERIVGTFHRLIRGARRWLRPCQIRRGRSSYELDNVARSKAVPRRNMTSAIGEELRAIPATDQLTPELRQLLRKVHRSDTRHSASRPRRSREMWLTDDEPRRIAEIFGPLPKQLKTHRHELRNKNAPAGLRQHTIA